MKTGKLLKKWMAALVAAILTISLFAIPAFAEDGSADKGSINVGLIVGLCIGAVVLIAVAILCIKFWDKIKKFFRVYKSEAKKIVWLSWAQTKKSTWVVLVALAVCATVICLLDVGLSQGIIAFIELFAPKA